MNSTLEFIIHKFKPDMTSPLPIPIHNINRTEMTKTLGELKFKVGVEVGVAEGLHAELLCANIPDLKLHLVDIYQKYEGYSEYCDPTKCLEEARGRLEGYDVNFIQKYSMDAVKDFPNNSLDFVYIDGAHDFKNVANDVYEWSKRVKLGGVVFGHDYKHWRPWVSKNVIEVRPVLEAYCYAKNIHPWFELTNDIRDKTFGRDTAGWMFVRSESDKV